MKQSISGEQLKELDFEQVNYLGVKSMLISYPKTFAEWERNKKKPYLTMYISLLEHLNIGRLIEILWEFKAPITYKLVFNGTDEKDHNFENLCDELWEDVKKVLMEHKDELYMR